MPQPYNPPTGPSAIQRGKRRRKVTMTRAVATIWGTCCAWKPGLRPSCYAQCPGPCVPPACHQRISRPLPQPLLMPYLSPNTVWIAWYILESLLYLVDIRNF